MQDHKKQDNITVNIISPPNDVKAVSKSPVGNAGTDPFCVYAHKRHAVGSKILSTQGPKSICTENSTWQNED